MAALVLLVGALFPRGVVSRCTNDPACGWTYSNDSWETVQNGTQEGLPRVNQGFLLAKMDKSSKSLF